MKQLFFLALLIISLSSFLLGCGKIDYDLVSSEEDESIPDVYMEGVVQIQSSGPDTTLYYITADSASLFSKKGDTQFENIQFQEINMNEEVLREGSARSAEFSRNNDAELSGGVVIDSLEDKMHIEGTSFSWNDSKQRLSSPPESSVLIVKEGETDIKGTGFEADFNLNEISFTQSVEGTIYHEE